MKTKNTIICNKILYGGQGGLQTTYCV